MFNCVTWEMLCEMTVYWLPEVGVVRLCDNFVRLE